MPQIWLSYDELGDLIGCGAAAARAAACSIPLDRRKCRDGLTRAKLNAFLTETFLDRLAQHWIDKEMSVCAGDLRETRKLMESHPIANARERAAVAG